MAFVMARRLRTIKTHCPDLYKCSKKSIKCTSDRFENSTKDINNTANSFLAFNFENSSYDIQIYDVHRGFSRELSTSKALDEETH